MSGVEILVLLPLLVIVLVLDTAVIDTLMGELRQMEQMSREAERIFSNSVPKVYGSLHP